MTNNTDMAQALAGGYLLADTTIRKFSGFIKDKAASEEVTARAGATHNAAKVQKDLLAGARAELKEVGATQAAIRQFLYTQTLPWNSSSDGTGRGPRLLSAAKSIEFLKQFKVMHTAYVVALDSFLNVYGARRAQAMQNLGSLANPDDYPDLNDIASMFAVDLDLSPVPAPTDFDRLAVPAALSESLGNIIAKKQNQAMENAMNDLSDRIVVELKRMAVQLGKKAAGEKTQLYATLLTNMESLTSLLRSSNFANDTKLDELADRLGECTKHDIETLKAHPEVAGEVAKVAVQITSDIEDDLYF